MIEPPCTERYARWCERSASQLMGSLLLYYDHDFASAKSSLYVDVLWRFRVSEIEVIDREAKKLVV